MTIIDLAVLLWRRWYVVLFGAVVCAIAIFTLLLPRTSYAVRGSVLMLAPDAVSESRQVPLIDLGAELSPFALAVEQAVNNSVPIVRMRSIEATLAGTGVREGTSAVVPNRGGQWNYYFPVPELMVQAVAPSADEAARLYEAEVRRVQSVAESLQKRAGVRKKARIQGIPKVADPPINYVGTTRGGRARAAAATLLLGAGLTLLAAFGWDQMAMRRANRREARPQIPQT